MDEAALLKRLEEIAAAGATPSLGIVGGTFDPIHTGHTALASAAARELDLDGLLFVPAGVPSFKRDRRLASAADRLAMARLATASLPSAAVSEREVDRPGITYAVDTLRALAADVPPSTRLVYVMGADTLASLPQWCHAAEVAALSEVAVAGRAGSEGVAEALEALDRAGLPVRVHELAAAVPQVSSTDLRAQLAQGTVAPGLLDPAVYAYIVDHHLYGVAPRSR